MWTKISGKRKRAVFDEAAGAVAYWDQVLRQLEVDGDFGDLLEDLESFVFEVDGAEADGLELVQGAGDTNIT